MPEFIVRIELHGAVESEYTTLHEEMEKVGFSRTIYSSTKDEYHLPHSEYYISDESLDTDKVNEKAQLSARLTKKKFGLLITEARLKDGISFVGLKPVTHLKT